MDKDTSVIPKGLYCYERIGPMDAKGSLPVKACPYWSSRQDKPEQESGHCAFLGHGDWENPHIGLLWDQVKECGINIGDIDADVKSQDCRASALSSARTVADGFTIHLAKRRPRRGAEISTVVRRAVLASTIRGLGRHGQTR